MSLRCTACRRPHLSAAPFLPAAHPPVHSAPSCLLMPRLSLVCKVSHPPACGLQLVPSAREREGVQLQQWVCEPIPHPCSNRRQLCVWGCTMAGSTFPHTECAPNDPEHAVEWGGGCAAMESACGSGGRGGGGRYDGRTADCPSPRCLNCSGPCRLLLLLLPRALQQHHG